MFGEAIRIPLNSVTFDEEEIQSAVAVLRSGRVTMGDRCREFESAFAAYLGVRNAVFVNSGSSANLLAFFGLANPLLPRDKGRRRMQPGDEVIVPAVTWSTTIWPIIQAGGVPVLVDSDPATLQMDLASVEAALSSRTVAICAVHVLGNAVPMQPLKALAARHGLWLIEDTCEALGVRHNGKAAGTFGAIGTYSFFFSHHITTIEGGMVATDDDGLAELFRCLRAHGWTRDLERRAEVEALYPDVDPRFLFVNLGFNVRPTEINAAFGLRQLARLERFNARRREIAAIWDAAFADLIHRECFRPMQFTPGTVGAPFGYPVICQDRASRDRLRNRLEACGIETRPIICGNMARQPALRHFAHRIHSPLTGADRIMDCGLLWSSDPLMTDSDVAYVADAVTQVFRK